MQIDKMLVLRKEIAKEKRNESIRLIRKMS